MPRPLAQPIDHTELLQLSATMTHEQLAARYACHPQTIATHLRAARAAHDPTAAYPVPHGWTRGHCHPNLPCWESCLDNIDAPCVYATHHASRITSRC